VFVDSCIPPCFLTHSKACVPAVELHQTFTDLPEEFFFDTLKAISQWEGIATMLKILGLLDSLHTTPPTSFANYIMGKSAKREKKLAKKARKPNKHTKQGRRLLAEAAKKRGKKKCRCGAQFRTVDMCTYHKRICVQAKELEASRARQAQAQGPLKLDDIALGKRVFLPWSRRGKRAKAAFGAIWKSAVWPAFGRYTPVWICTHPETQRLVVSLQKWPYKIEVEEYFFNQDEMRGARQLFDESGKSLCKWNGAREIC